MSLTSALPLPLQKAIDLVPWLVASLTKSRPGLIRTMRPERQDSLKKILTTLLLSCSLQHDGAICYVNDKWAKPKTLKEIAEEAGVSYPCAKRCLAFLKQVKLIKSKQVKRKNKINGQVEVSPGLRYFTPEFWQKLDLWKLFQQSVAWAKRHCRRFFFLPFKAVKLAEKGIREAAEVVGEVLQNMSEDAIRARYWCDKIRKNLRQNK